VNRVAALTLAYALAASAACQPPATTRPLPVKQLAVLDLVGDWRWLYRADEQGTSRIEEENWRLATDPAVPMRLVGRYLRTVEVRSTDIVPFKCNQRRSYRQRALYDVMIDVDGDDLIVRETGYTAEESPCDHGFRHIAEYKAEPRGNRLALHWPTGSQTLWQIDSTNAPLPETPWQTKPALPTGPWRWQAISVDDDGNHREEAEWWEVSRRSDTELDATYRRRVTVRSPDGKTIACANAPAWSYDDVYALRGQREEEHWHLYELAADPGDHPCLRTTPKRSTDEATAEQIGNYFVLEWRGKRRQILYRPEDE
jgi:hypothetical protein